MRLGGGPADIDHPNLLLRPFGEPRRVRYGMILALHIASAHIDQRFPVRSKFRRAQFLTIVIAVMSDLAGRVALSTGSRLGNPDIPSAADVGNPGYPPFCGGGPQVGAERSTERLFDRERCRLRYRRQRLGQNCCGKYDRQPMKSDPSVHSFASMGITQKELCHM